jgi:hypothetical protein
MDVNAGITEMILLYHLSHILKLVIIKIHQYAALKAFKTNGEIRKSQQKNRNHQK